MWVNKKFFAILFIVLVGIFAVQSQTANKPLADRFLERANEAFDNDNINEAFKNINGALAMSKDSIPANVLSLSKSIYRVKLKKLMEKFDEQQFIEIVSSLEQYPDVNDAGISKLVRQIEAKQEAAEKDSAKKEQKEFIDSLKNQSEDQKAVVEAYQEMYKEANAKNQELISVVNESTAAQQESNAVQRENNELQRKNNEKQARNYTTMFILIGVIVLIIFLLVAVILYAVKTATKQSRIQQMQYAEAFKLLAQNQSQTNQLMLGGITDIYGENGLKSAGSSRWGVDALPEPEETPEERDEMRDLAAKCEDLGARIDQITGRKNNSKNVSELVYKLAIKLGMRQRDAMVYFCAAMVYDAGFMSVDSELLRAEQLTDEQRKELNLHTDKAEENLQFVPRRYWQIFEDAAKWHHENMDGSGKNGLKGDEIPQIARIIRVADSFVAMSSKRSYRGGMDKDSVCEALAEQSNIYDSDVIDALKDII